MQNQGGSKIFSWNAVKFLNWIHNCQFVWLNSHLGILSHETATHPLSIFFVSFDLPDIKNYDKNLQIFYPKFELSSKVFLVGNPTEIFFLVFLLPF